MDRKKGQNFFFDKSVCPLFFPSFQPECLPEDCGFRRRKDEG
jgi:hypothetical protein